MIDDKDENFSQEFTLFDKQFVVKRDVLVDSKYRGFYNDERITEGYPTKLLVINDIIKYYENNFMKLEHFIENINEGGEEWMKEDPDNRFVTPFSEDTKYWNAKGISTVPQFRHYIDDELEFTT